MKNIIIKAEFLAGTTITDAAESLTELAVKLDVIVSTNFNGVTLLAGSSSKVSDIVADYRAQIKSIFNESRRSQY